MDILAGGPSVSPSSSANAGVKALFQCEPLGHEEQMRLRQALDAAAAIQQKQQLTITPQLVGRQAAGRRQQVVGPVAGATATSNAFIVTQTAFEH